MTTTTSAPRRGASAKAATGTADYLDQRTGIGLAVKNFARKVFPDHWSFMLGEIALYSFVVLILTGIFLTMFFVPSMGPTVYHGPYAPMDGVEMSEAFASTLRISFEVTGGLLMRQIHHWAALLFMAAIVTHMMRVFFTGAFRKPREINWLVGFLLLVLGLAAGFSGYSLPDDVLSGNGLRITDGAVKSIPVLGAWMSYMIFGGEFPGHDIVPRLFTVHILIVPGLILALVGLHLFLVVLHKHTHYPGPGRTHRNVVGFPLFPVYVAKAGGFFFIVFGLLALLAATITINPVWNYGPYDPSPVGAGAQPDWYMLFLEGSLRLMPGMLHYGNEISLEPVIGGFTISLNVLIPALIIPGLFFTFLAVYPFIEAWVTGDKREHHVLDRPRNAPVRTALGVAFLTGFFILALAGTNDLIATHFSMSLNDITRILRVLFFAGPVLAFIATKRICLGLQRKDREIALHGRETGRIVRLPHGEYIEVHEPLDEYDRWLLVGYEAPRPIPLEPAEDERGVRRKGYRRDRFRHRLSRFFYEDRIEPITPAELAAAQSHGEHDDLAGTDRLEGAGGHSAGPLTEVAARTQQTDAETGTTVGAEGPRGS